MANGVLQPVSCNLESIPPDSKQDDNSVLCRSSEHFMQTRLLQNTCDPPETSARCKKRKADWTQEDEQELTIEKRSLRASNLLCPAVPIFRALCVICRQGNTNEETVGHLGTLRTASETDMDAASILLFAKLIRVSTKDRMRIVPCAIEGTVSEVDKFCKDRYKTIVEWHSREILRQSKEEMFRRQCGISRTIMQWMLSDVNKLHPNASICPLEFDFWTKNVASADIVRKRCAMTTLSMHCITNCQVDYMAALSLQSDLEAVFTRFESPSEKCVFTMTRTKLLILSRTNLKKHVTMTTSADGYEHVEMCDTWLYALVIHTIACMPDGASRSLFLRLIEEVCYHNDVLRLCFELVSRRTKTNDVWQTVAQCSSVDSWFVELDDKTRMELPTSEEVDRYFVTQKVVST